MIKKNKESTLLLGTVGFTNAFLDAFNFKGKQKDETHPLQLLDDALKKKDSNFKRGFFQDDNRSDYDSEYTNFSRSDSSYQVISKKDILFSYEMKPCKIAFNQVPDLNSNDLEFIDSIIEEDLYFKDNHIYFLENGNAVILGMVDLKAVSVDGEGYEMMSKLLHKAFKYCLKDTTIKILKTYQSTFFNTLDKFHLNDKLFKFNLFNSDKLLKEFHQKSIQASFSFAIYNHIFDKSNLPESMDITNLFQKSEYKYKNKGFTTFDAKIYFGYTHSVYALKTEENVFQELLIKYRIPLLVILANWSAIRSLSLNLEYLSKRYLIKGKSSFNLFGLKKERDALKRSLLMFKKITASLEGYNATNHPIYYHLIETYRDAFMEKKSLMRLHEQIEVTTAYSEEIDRLRTQR